ncbi:L-threonylcarbamoyladenylate synthase [Gracilinema caldarium]|uniref:L-threonylcarbamoyladenylate synthase n=1 Tax=Gracilinema caldarium TaxID=215591 RepID=UPI0026F233BB|nr:L-threonylcarbamoyladenylate synthase [Gracilinema caldarium]
MAILLSTVAEDIEWAARAIREGKLVAFPTETVYGLGGQATNTAALARIFEAKRRPTFDPLIVHIAAREQLSDVADLALLSEKRRNLVQRLAENLWPGPLTLILPKQNSIPDLATSGLATVAVRLPAHPVARDLIRRAGVPVAAPSANPFGYLSPTKAEHVLKQLGDRVDFIIDGGKCEVGVESTVLDLSGDTITIMRPGGLSRERIESLIGPVTHIDRTTSHPTAPGQLPSHYAPRASLSLYPLGAIPVAIPELPQQRLACLFFDETSRSRWLADFIRTFPGKDAPVTRVLAPSSLLLEAAANLFDILHELDALGVDRILAERVPDRDLGPAINDRLYKARGEAKESR